MGWPQHMKPPTMTTAPSWMRATASLGLSIFFIGSGEGEVGTAVLDEGEAGPGLGHQGLVHVHGGHEEPLARLAVQHDLAQRVEDHGVAAVLEQGVAARAVDPDD